MAKGKAGAKNQMAFDFDGDAVVTVSAKKKVKVKSKTKTVSKLQPKAKRTKKVSGQVAKSKTAVKNVTDSKVVAVKAVSKGKKVQAATAESMAAKQRDISISEFFAKNRHLLGFDNPRKALLTAVKEAVDNSLDACEEAHILPDIGITIKQLSESKYRLTVTDNGPGIVKQQVPNIFGRLLYGSKFHSLKMSRGQQGIGISAAGMYGLLTTGEPVEIISRTKPEKSAHHYHIQIDTAKNKPEIVLDETCDFELATGTSVTITLQGKYQKGKQSVDEYIAQTAMANPHTTIVYNAPDGKSYEYERQSHELPFIAKEIKPHPYGVELGLLYKMARESESKQLAGFLKSDFSRVSSAIAGNICEKAKVSPRLWLSTMTLKQAEAVHTAINETKIMAPSSSCIGPIGEEKLEEGLQRVVDAKFFTSSSRSPSVYRGNPFLIEAALAYGVETGRNSNGETEKEPLMRLIRVANRVPLLYQQSACAFYKGVLETNWRNYQLSQNRGALPNAPVVLLVHIASVWVPFTSESKEAIAHYPEIIKEIKLAVQDCGRKLGIYLRKQKRVQQELIKRGYIETYLPHIGEALRDILTLKPKQVERVVDSLKDVLEKSRKM